MAEPMDVSTGDSAKFALSATLAGHEQDVRAVHCTADGAVLTASRDHSVRVWPRSEAAEGGAYAAPSTLTGHTHFVIAVCPTPSGAASGSNDKHVIEWDLQGALPLRVLDGHTNTVSCVVYSSVHGLLYSASWDKTVKVWKEGECLRTLEGHEATVWAVLPLDDADGRVLTASGDRTIKLWKETTCEVTYEGHQDVVRALALAQGVGFLSASNDGTVRLWDLAGSMLHVLRASESFVYGVAILPGTGEWMTCSEDRTLKIWEAGGGECVQSLTHPSTVWSCAALPNGDVVAGCADANAYVWTREPSRAAPQAEQLQFKETVSSVALPAQQAAGESGGELSDLAKMTKTEEALTVPGTKEGEHLFVKTESGATMLYQWSTASSSWEKVGEVTGSNNDDGGTPSLGKRWYEGAEFDYLFDIDINGAPLKLPFNRGDDPWMAAQQWIWKHGIDQMHLDAVAKHLIDNTPGNVPQAQAGNADPFTAGGAYRPAAPAANGAGGGFSGNVDPFTAGGAYRPGQPNPTAGGGSGNVDPFTSGGAYRPGAPRPSAPPPAAGGGGSAAAGASTFVTFDTCKHDAVLGKLMQFNAQAAEGMTLDAAASERLQKLVGLLKQGAGSVSAEDVALFAGGGGGGGGLLSWPLALLFPAVDLFRLVVLIPSAASLLASNQSTPILALLLSRMADVQAAPPGDKPAAAAGQMLLRCFANMAARAELSGLVAAAASSLVEQTSAPMESGTTGARLAACTLLYNLTILLSKGGVPADAALLSEEWRLQALSLIGHALSNVAAFAVPAEEESLIRLLLALNALVTATAAGKQAAKELDVGSALQGFALADGASARAKEVLKMVRASVA